ncbi:hypothetical protein AB0J71_26790 [Nonomuraea sp. NPDC049637]|uniref:hypothetical protein n=1 Tax=Nonomuraea sp. NPDC049637 TaxID=3154356 RepID=UPI003427E8E5
MFKRRLAVLGTVGVLALAGLGGSALADGTPAPDATTTTTMAVSCRTPDGKEVKLADGPAARVFVMRDEKGERADGAPELKAERGRVIELAPRTSTEATPATPSAPAAPQSGTEAAPTTPSATLPEGEAVPAVPATPLTDAETGPAALPEGEAARVLPALPATELPPGAVKLDDPSKVVRIVCAPAESVK